MKNPIQRYYRSRLPLAAVLSSAALAFSTTTLSGTPDWTGRWVVADSFQDHQDGTSLGNIGARGSPALGAPPPGGLPIPELPLKGKYLDEHVRLLKTLMAADAVGKYLNVLGDCKPLGMPRFWAGPYTFEILVNPKQINIFQESWEQTRRVYMDGRKHPSLDDSEPLYQGHSVGHWEGKVLVIDTVNINPASLIGLFDQHSDALHVVERIRHTSRDYLEVNMTVDDPEALTRPLISTVLLHRKPDMEILDYICAENDRNPIDANGAYTFELKSK